MFSAWETEREQLIKQGNFTGTAAMQPQRVRRSGNFAIVHAQFGEALVSQRAQVLRLAATEDNEDKALTTSQHGKAQCYKRHRQLIKRHNQHQQYVVRPVHVLSNSFSANFSLHATSDKIHYVNFSSSRCQSVILLINAAVFHCVSKRQSSRGP